MMEKEKVVFFLDYANINRTATEKRYQLDYADLLEYISEERKLIDAHCYVPINPRNEHRRDREIEGLWRSGYMVTSKIGTISGGTYKCNFDVEIAMDMVKAAYQVKPDIMVLATGDSDFVAVIQELRKSGIRVEVAAFEETAGNDIQLKCSGFIDLDVYYADYLATQNSEPSEEQVDVRYRNLLQSQIGKHDDGDERIDIDGLEEEHQQSHFTESELNTETMLFDETLLAEEKTKLDTDAHEVGVIDSLGNLEL